MAADKNITEEEFEEIARFFYKTGSATKAFLALQYFINSDLLSNAIETGPHGPMPYFFYRVAQIHTELWPKYTALFESSSQRQRLFILWLFALEKSEDTDKCLSAWRENRDYEELQSQIDVLLGMEGRGKNAIEIEKVSTGSDLDRLWGEFLITGNKATIQKIIDVLEWPDLIRGRIEKSLQQPEILLQEYDSISKFREQLLNQGIVLDNSCGSIYSAQDLDCFSIMDGCEISSDRLETMKLIFPFELSDSDLNHIGMKASAKWSLCSNAMQDEAVLEICIEDAGKRGGGCRLSLLEIITRRYLATDDLEQGLKYFIESLILDPVARGEQNERAEETYKELLSLKIDADKQIADMVSGHEMAIMKCLDICESLTTYRAKMFWREQGTDSGQEGTIYWEMEYIQPDRFRVAQTAGDDFDEWITVAGLHHRGPMYMRSSDQTMFESDLWFNQTLQINNYLSIMREAHVEAISTHNSELGDYLILDYFHVDNSKLRLFREREGDIDLSLMRLWIEITTNYLVKVEIVVSMKNNKGSLDELNIVHLFTGYNDDISIIPPPFEIVNYEEANSKKLKGIEPLKKWRRNIRLSGFSTGVLAGIGLAYFVTPADSVTLIADYIFFSIIIGVFFGAVGYILAEISRWFMPSQRNLARIEKNMKTSKDILQDRISIIVFLIVLILGFIRYCGVID